MKEDSLEYLLVRALAEGFDIRQEDIGVYAVGIIFKGWDKGTFVVAGRGATPLLALQSAMKRCGLNASVLTLNL